MKIEFAARVDIGPKETNDDRVLVSGSILDKESCSGTVETPSMAVVCDGCGGYAGGYVAAETVLELLSYESPETLSDEDYLSQVLAGCETAVAEKKEEMPNFSSMCTTVAGCVFCDDSIVIFHSGDSRVYRRDRWGLARMTRDHSVVQEMVDMGQLTPEEALVSPKRNIISRCIGVNSRPPEIYKSHAPINPGEKYLLCSDGLWESVGDETIREILDTDMPTAQMAETLVDLALERGAEDNISVCILASQGEAQTEENKPFILD